MPQARIENIEALKRLKIALIKFAESANIAIGDAESEVNRTMIWLQNEQTTYWNSQFRKRHDIVERCKEAVRMKKLFKDSTGRQQSAVEEEKALQIALRRKQEAEEKLVAVRKAIKRLERETPLYKGSVQRFATNVQVDIPAAAAHLENLLASLEAYIGLSAPVEVTSTTQVASTATGAGGETRGSMARPVEEQETSEEEHKESQSTAHETNEDSNRDEPR